MGKVNIGFVILTYRNYNDLKDIVSSIKREYLLYNYKFL